MSNRLDQHDATSAPGAGLQPVTIVVLAIMFAGAGALAAGFWLRPKPLELVAATPYPQPRAIADFALTDGEGKHFDLDRWKGQWDIVFFGFTHCPDICPNTLNELKLAAAELRRQGRPAPGVTFVSVDPERDTPARLKQYVTYFDPAFQGATGDPEQLLALTRQLGVIYHIAEHEPGATSYGVDHSAALLLVDPEARLHAVFSAPHEAGRIAADLTVLMRG